MRRSAFGPLVAAVAIVATAGGCATAPPPPPPPLIAPILAVQAERYTGGLTPEHRRIAEQVHSAMAPRFREVCPPPDPNDGRLVEFPNDRERPSLFRRTDPDLAALIVALNHPRQEVRDLSAYTIGLLGPSAKAAQPTLRAKWSDRNVKGGWFNSALAKVSCKQIVEADFRRTIPDDALPWGEPFGMFLETSARLMAELYLDETLSFPPGMMAEAYSPSYGIGPAALRAGVAPILVRILEDDSLGRQKHLEAVQALHAMGTDATNLALPILIARQDTADPELKTFIVDALLNSGSEAAIPGLIERIRGDGDSWDMWKRDVCWYGPAAISAEDRLIDVALNGRFAHARNDAIDTLVCIGSKRAVPILTSVLERPDWQINERAARALGQLGVADPAAIAALTKLYDTHWSVRLRKVAWESLSALGVERPEPVPFYRPEPPKPPPSTQATADEIPETVLIGGPTYFDHGLPWCDPAARYSIDGTTWFPVDWKKPVLERVPETFRGRDYLQSVGTQSFLRVGDGWLFGSEGFEGIGFFLYVSDSGAITRLIEPGASIASIFRYRGRYLAIGWELATGDAAGLIEISRSPDGKWSGKTILTLPGPVFAYAVAPTGELLLGDGPNGIAIVGDKIVPMKCEVAFPRSFFAER